MSLVICPISYQTFQPGRSVDFSNSTWPKLPLYCSPDPEPILSSILVSYRQYNKSPQTWCLKTTNICYIKILKVKSLKIRTSAGLHCFLGLWREHFLPSSASRIACILWLMAPSSPCGANSVSPSNLSLSFFLQMLLLSLHLLFLLQPSCLPLIKTFVITLASPR